MAGDATCLDVRAYPLVTAHLLRAVLGRRGFVIGVAVARDGEPA